MGVEGAGVTSDHHPFGSAGAEEGWGACCGALVAVDTLGQHGTEPVGHLKGDAGVPCFDPFSC